MFRIFRSSHVLILLLLFLLFSGLGCRGLSKEQKASIKSVKLNYWTVYGNVDELKKLAAEYKAMRPYVTVNIRQLRYEEFDDIFVNALADDVAPDIVSVHTRNLSKYTERLSPMPASVKVANVVTKGKYQPETTVTMETIRLPGADAVKSQYVSAVGDDVIRGGNIYGLPLTLDTLALIYNKELLDRAGVPIVPSTWDDVVKAVEKTTKYNNKGEIVQSGAALGTGKNIDNAFDILSVLMMQNGVTMAAGNRAAFASGLERGGGDKHPSLEALRFYTDFARPTKKTYAWNDSLGNATTEFSGGRVAMLVGFAYDAARLKRLSPRLTIGTAPLPQLHPDNPVNVANYWVEGVVKKSAHQDEAWDFIRYLSLPDNVKRYAGSVGAPSPLRVHITDDAKANIVVGPFVEAVLTAKNWYRGKDPVAARGAFVDLITKYLLPYSETERNPLERDRNLLLTAQQTVQQTY